MCGRFVSLLSPELLQVIFDVSPAPPMAPRYNIAPTQMVPVVRQDASGSRYLSTVRWGLVPSWAKDIASGSMLINARCETVHEKPSFRQAIRSRRCLIPGNGFYEWGKTASGKEPYYLSLRDGSPMAFAGIWETWRTPEGDTLESCAILTTNANTLMAPIHDRMPVILHPAEYTHWLDRTINDPHDFERLYQPFPAELMQAWRVSKLVNSPAHDSEECIHRIP